MSVLQRDRIHFTDEGRKARIAGIDQPTATVHKGTPTSRVVVLKVPGHSYWSGRGEQSYAPAEFQVYERIEENGEPTMWHREVTSFPVRTSS